MGAGDVGCTPLIKQGYYLQTGESNIQSQLTDTTHQGQTILDSLETGKKALLNRKVFNSNKS